MSQPADDDSSSFAPPFADGRPPPYGAPYGQPPGTPPSAYGQSAPPHGPPAQGPYAGQWGYGPPGNPGQPRTQPMGDDTTWTLFAYLGTLLVGFLVPLVIYFVKRNESAFVRFHAAQALNYVITQLCILLLVMVPTIVLAIALETPAILIILAPLILFEIISQYVYLILGTIRSHRGEWYRLPRWLCWRMIR
jgi:uncharacterized protein